MSETRQMVLYRIEADGSVNPVTRKWYQFTTLSNERQIATDLANDYGYRQGDGYVHIQDSDGAGLEVLDLEP